MSEEIKSKDIIQFNQLTTSLKSMETINSDERYFEGLLTVQMKDKQGEVTIVDELYKVLPIWMDRGAPISDTHSNRIIGKGINYSKTIVKDEHGEDLPAIKITGKIYKNYELDNVIWNKIVTKEYRGLSFGGATRANRMPMKMKDGSMAYALGALEHYEVAVCKDPAVPMAIITDFNPIAKANYSSTVRDDKMVIQCTDMGCYIEKSDVEHGMYGNVNTDTPFDATEDYEEDKREEIEKVESSTPKGLGFGKIRGTGEKTEAKITPDTKFFGADGKPYKTQAEASAASPRKRRNISAERKERADYKAQAGVSIKDRLDMKNDADLNESQTFQEKVDALIREGKSEESAKKIVGSFVHKELLIKSGYQTEAGNTQLGGQASTEDDKEKREKEDEEKEDDEVKRRDHSDAGGDIHSMYNQNVGREASSGRKMKTLKKLPTRNQELLGGSENSQSGLPYIKPEHNNYDPEHNDLELDLEAQHMKKGDTTVNQTGGIRGGQDTAVQGSGESNDINIVQKKPERNEEKLISNIKVVRNINNSLEKHSQIQELKKIKGSLPKKFTDDNEYIFDKDLNVVSAGEQHTDLKGLNINSRRNSKLGNKKEISHGDSIVQDTGEKAGFSQFGERMRDNKHALQGTLSRRNAEIMRSYIKKVKNINNSLVKHSQIQELKKLNNIIKPMTYSNSKFAMTYPKVGEKVWDSKQQKLVVENKKPKKGNSALNDKNASIQALKKIKSDLGDARGCTEHLHG